MSRTPCASSAAAQRSNPKKTASSSSSSPSSFSALAKGCQESCCPSCAWTCPSSCAEWSLRFSALDLGLAAVRLFLLRLVGGRCRLALALRVHLVVPVPFEPFGSLLRRSPVLAGRALAFVHLPGDAVQIAVGMLVLGCTRLAKLPPAPLAVACRRPSWSFPFGGVATGDAR